MYGKSCNLRTLSREYDFVLPKSALRKGSRQVVTGKLGQTSNSLKGQHATTRTDTESKTKIYEKIIIKKSPFVVDFGCIR